MGGIWEERGREDRGSRIEIQGGEGAGRRRARWKAGRSEWKCYNEDVCGKARRPNVNARLITLFGMTQAICLRSVARPVGSTPGPPRLSALPSALVMHPEDKDAQLPTNMYNKHSAFVSHFPEFYNL